MSTCPRCHADFTCAMADQTGQNAPCWCTQLAPLAPPDRVKKPGAAADAVCYCPACLRQLVESSGQACEGAAPTRGNAGAE